MAATRSCLIAVVLLSVIAGSVGAQPLWLDRSSDRVVSLEFLKPSFNSDFIASEDLGFFTATWFLSARIAANDVFTIVGEAPFSKFSDDRFDGSSTIGNIYLGAEIHNLGAGVFVELGARVPVADDEEVAMFSGALTEFIDRYEAFIGETVPVLIAFNHYRQRSTGLVTRIRVGPTFWVPTGDRDEAEFFMVYGGQVGYSSTAASVMVGLSGRWILTEDTEGFGEATTHQFAITAGPRLGRAHPAFHLRVPMDDDLNDIIDLVWGLSVSVDVSP